MIQEKVARESASDEIDAGIRKAVDILRANGVETFESCQGGRDHAFFEPTIRFHGGKTEGLRAAAIALSEGLNPAELRRYWSFEEGELKGPWWELTFTPTVKAIEDVGTAIMANFPVPTFMVRETAEDNSANNGNSPFSQRRKEEMKIHYFEKPKEGFENYDSSQLYEGDFERIVNLRVDEIWYWYGVGNNCGTGYILMRTGKLYDWYYCGHCSCNGPTSGIEFTGKPWNEIIKGMTKDFARETKELFADAKRRKK